MTQSPVHCVPGTVSQRVKQPGREANHFLPSAAVAFNLIVLVAKLWKFIYVVLELEYRIRIHKESAHVFKNNLVICIKI
jgi:uncharacterized membrane protein